MADTNNRRITAMLLQGKVEEVFQVFAPLRMLSCQWVLNSIDDDLPTEAEVAAVLAAYSAASIPALNTRSAIRELETSEAGEGFVFPDVPECGAESSAVVVTGLTIPSATGLTISSATGLTIPSGGGLTFPQTGLTIQQTGVTIPT